MKVLILDDTNQKGHELAQTLGDRPVSFVHSQADRVEEVTGQNPDVILYFTTATKSYINLCRKIAKQHPYLPILFVGLDAKEPRPIAPSRMYRYLTTTTTKSVAKSLYRQLHDMSQYGYLKQQLFHTRETIKKLSKLTLLSDFSNYELFMSKMLSYLAEEFSAKNVFFLEPGDFEYFAHEMWRTRLQPRQGGDEDSSAQQRLLRSYVHSNHEVLSTYVNSFDVQGASSGYTTVLASQCNGEQLILVPLFDESQPTPVAHIILVEPLHYAHEAYQNFRKKMFFMLGRYYSLAKTHRETKLLTYVDDVTGLYNQRFMMQALDKELKRATRFGEPFSVLFIDIDHFKKVNDYSGHLVGSKLLNELGKIFKDNIRTTDYGFRYGGDEYLLLLSRADSSTAKLVAERIRKQVEETVFLIDGNKIHLTLSVGVASFPEHGLTKEEVLRLADQAMYHGKSKSRNVVYVAVS